MPRLTTQPRTVLQVETYMYMYMSSMYTGFSMCMYTAIASQHEGYMYMYMNVIASLSVEITLYSCLQVHVLKRMGGMQESGHMCRLLSVQHVREMCEYHRVTVPSSLTPLCRNELPKGRKGKREINSIP